MLFLRLIEHDGGYGGSNLFVVTEIPDSVIAEFRRLLTKLPDLTMTIPGSDDLVGVGLSIPVYSGVVRCDILKSGVSTAVDTILARELDPDTPAHEVIDNAWDFDSSIHMEEWPDLNTLINSFGLTGERLPHWRGYCDYEYCNVTSGGHLDIWMSFHAGESIVPHNTVYHKL